MRNCVGVRVGGVRSRLKELDSPVGAVGGVGAIFRIRKPSPNIVNIVNIEIATHTHTLVREIFDPPVFAMFTMSGEPIRTPKTRYSRRRVLACSPTSAPTAPGHWRVGAAADTHRVEIMSEECA